MTPQSAYEHIPNAVKIAADALSFSVIIGTLFEHLPSIAAGLSVIWSLIRIYETRTLQRFFKRLKPSDPDNSN